MNIFSRRAIQNIDPSFTVDQHRHATASARARLGFPSRPFGREGFPVIVRLRYPNLPSFFARCGSGTLSMPRHEDATCRIGGYGPTAIQAEGAGHQVSLRLEGSVRIVETTVKHRRSGLSRFGVDWSIWF